MSLIKSASTVSLFTLMSRITGMVRELFMASAFGANAMTDAFNIAFRIPNLFRRFFAEGAFSQAFVPTLAAYKAKEGGTATHLLISRVATVLVWILIFVCVLGVLAAPFLVWSMASGLQKNNNQASYDAAIHMTRFMFPYIGFMSLVALSSGVLNTWRKFAIPAATPVLLNLCMIVAAWLGAPWFKNQGFPPIYAMALAVIIGGFLQLAIQIPALKRLGLLPKIKLSWRGFKHAWSHEGTQNVIRLMLPALLGVGVAQISMLINTQIASYLAAGSVSWITYSDRLMEFPTAMLGVALGVVLMPQLAMARVNKDAKAYSEMLDWGLRLVFLLALPSAVALLVFAKPLVAVLYHYGAFTERDVVQTTQALMGWGVGLIGVVAIKVLAPAYFAEHDTKTPVKIAIFVLIITQILNYFLVPIFQHAALTLSIGLGALINALWLLIGLIKRNSFKPLAGWGLFALQVVAGSFFLAAFLAWANQSFNWLILQKQALDRIGLLMLILLGGAILYFAVLLISGVKLRKVFLLR